jgi:8-hydroxy-5-deazaflavin:NADPH oxidoreductase
VRDGDADATRDILPADRNLPKTFQSAAIMSQKIAILGTGKAGSALQAGAVPRGVWSPFRQARPIVPTASWADVIILAVPFRAPPEVARELGTAADGKTVVDVTNAPDLQLAVGFTTSGAEELQKALPRAKRGQGLQYGIRAAHEQGQRWSADGLCRRWQRGRAQGGAGVGQGDRLSVDGGPLKNARYLEPLAFLNVQLSWVLDNGPNVGFKFVH